MKWFHSILIGAMAGATALSSSAWAEGAVAIATASSAGLYYAAGDAICRAVSSDFQKKKIGCSVVASLGSTANILKLDAANLQFGIVQSDVQFHALEGRDVFAFVGAAQEIRSVLSLHTEAFTVLVRADSAFLGIDDLRGKRFNLGPLGTGTLETGDDLLNALGWSATDRSGISNFALDQNGKNLCDGKVDAVAFLAGHPSASIQQVSKTCPTRLISLKPEVIEKLIKDKPYYAAVDIAGSLYPGNPAPTHTLGVKATLVTLAKVPDELVFALVSSVFEHLDALKKSSPAFSELEADQMVWSGLTAPLHSGALKYYQQMGWISPNGDAKAQASAGGGAIPPSLHLNNIKAPDPMELKPSTHAAAPVKDKKFDSGVVKPKTAPARTKEKWESEPNPF